MAGESTFFEASGGWRLHVESWAAAGGQAPKAAALLLHGVNESSQTLTARRLAAALGAKGIALHALEHHGHGLSIQQGGHKQPLGLVDGLDRLVAHTAEAAVHVGKRHGPSVPLVVIGHSMGAAVAAVSTRACREALTKEWGASGSGAEGEAPRLAGAVFLAPPVSLTMGDGPGVLTMAALRFLSVVYPSLAIGPPEHPEGYCPPDVGPPGRNYAGKMRARTSLMFLDFEAASFEQRRKAGDVDFGDLPFLVVRGAQDNVVGLEGCRRLLGCGSRGELLELPDAGHQMIAVGSGHERVVEQVVSWIFGALGATK